MVNGSSLGTPPWRLSRQNFLKPRDPKILNGNHWILEALMFETFPTYFNIFQPLLKGEKTSIEFLTLRGNFFVVATLFPYVHKRIPFRYGNHMGSEETF